VFFTTHASQADPPRRRAVGARPCAKLWVDPTARGNRDPQYTQRPDRKSNWCSPPVRSSHRRRRRRARSVV